MTNARLCLCALPRMVASTWSREREPPRIRTSSRACSRVAARAFGLPPAWRRTRKTLTHVTLTHLRRMHRAAVDFLFTNTLIVVCLVSHILTGSYLLTGLLRADARHTPHARCGAYSTQPIFASRARLSVYNVQAHIAWTIDVPIALWLVLSLASTVVAPRRADA